MESLKKRSALKEGRRVRGEKRMKREERKRKKLVSQLVRREGREYLEIG